MSEFQNMRLKNCIVLAGNAWESKDRAELVWVRYGIKSKCNKLLAQVGVPTPRFGPFQAYRINPKCRAKYRNQLVLPIFLV